MASNAQAGFGDQRGITMVEVVIILAISMVMAALTSQSMQSAVAVYQMSRSCRQLAAFAQQARTMATGHATRYRVRIDITARQYWFERCSSPSSTDRTCNGWTDDQYSGRLTLPKGIDFSAAGITVAPPDQSSVTLVTDMSFNSIGLLWDEGTGLLSDGRCFYLQATGLRPMAVCSTMAGKTTVFRLFSGVWEVQ